MSLKLTEKFKTRKGHYALLLVLPVIIVVVCIFLLLSGGRYVTTDNAYVKSNKTPVSSEINGRIEQVLVADNTRVKTGQLLFSIEKEPFIIAEEKARANLATVSSDIESIRAEYLQRQAELQRAEENLSYQKSEYDRANALFKTNIIARARLEAVQHGYNDAMNNRNALAQELAAQAAKLAGDPETPVEQHPRYKQALAELHKAELDLSHVNINAPSDGIAANVTMRPGEYVAAGLPLFSIVEDTTPWIEANFKETDLTFVRPGQEAVIEIDTYPGRKWHAVVSSITPATGSEFSLLPSENSSGNWVKVVQRLMVKLELKDYDRSIPVSAGMSAYVKIDTGKSRMSRWVNGTE